jgi:hypothetical protein
MGLVRMELFMWKLNFENDSSWLSWFVYNTLQCKIIITRKVKKCGTYQRESKPPLICAWQLSHPDSSHICSCVSLTVADNACAIVRIGPCVTLSDSSDPVAIICSCVPSVYPSSTKQIFKGFFVQFFIYFEIFDCDVCHCPVSLCSIIC